EQASSLTPLADTYGIITPSSLHFERHHSGVPKIEPATHTLMIHGMVDRPIVLSVDEIRRLPSQSRIHFVECSGNGGNGWRPTPRPTGQGTHGLTSCSEGAGGKLSLLLEGGGGQAGAAPGVAPGGGTGERSRRMA